MPLNDLFAWLDDRTDVDTGALVGLLELGQTILFGIGVEADEALIVGTVVANDDAVSVDIIDYTILFGGDLCAREADDRLFETSANDR